MISTVDHKTNMLFLESSSCNAQHNEWQCDSKISILLEGSKYCQPDTLKRYRLESDSIFLDRIHDPTRKLYSWSYWWIWRKRWISSSRHSLHWWKTNVKIQEENIYRCLIVKNLIGLALQHTFDKITVSYRCFELSILQTLITHGKKKRQCRSWLGKSSRKCKMRDYIGIQVHIKESH